MLIDINLLPRKEYRNRAILIMVLIILIVVLSIVFLMYLQMDKVKLTERQLSSQIKVLQTKRAEAEQEYTIAQESSNVIKLEKAVQWANDYFIETVPLLDQLTRLLSERGFFQSFSYIENGVIALTIQFDTTKEVAHYLGQLNKSPYIEKAIVHSISTAPIEEQIVTGDENGEGTVKATKKEVDGNEYLPRYLAIFEITINKEYVKSIQREGK